MSRQHIPGLDKPAASSIRTNPDLTPHLRFQAVAHERNRLESVAEVLALVAVIRRQGVLTGGEVVAVQKAVFQFGKGVRVDATNAAHCLPGHLMFNARTFHTMPEWDYGRLLANGVKPLPLASKLRNLSGRTDVVDEAVNKTDSALEIMAGGRGLKPLFGQVAAQVTQHPRLTAAADWGTALGVATEALASYQREASILCRARIQELSGSVGSGPTNDPQVLKARYGTAVAQEYLLALANATSPPDALTPAGFDWIVRDVVRDR